MGSKRERLLVDGWLIHQLFNRRSMLAMIILSTMNCFYNKAISHSLESVTQSSLEMYALNMFGGYVSSMFELATLTSYLIIVILPIFFISSVLSSLGSYQSIPYIIRFGEKKVFLEKFVRTSLIFISLSYLIYVVISLLSLFIFNFDVVTFELLTSKMLVGSTVLRFLEMIVVFYIVVIMYALMKNAITSFLTVFVAYAVSVMGIGLFKLNPFGISSLMRWVEYDNGFVKVFALLAVMIGVMHVVLKKYLSNKFV